MTTLPAKAGNFSGHARANAPRCVLRAPSEPEYVLRGINVPVACVPAALAAVYTDRESFLDLREITAAATRLSGHSRIYRDDSHSSLLRFLCEYRKQLSPSRIVSRLRKACAGYTSNAQGFVGYEPVPTYQLASQLVVEVSSLVGNLLVHPSNVLASFAAMVRTFLLASDLCARRRVF